MAVARIFALTLLLLGSSEVVSDETHHLSSDPSHNKIEYGVDVSFPMHHSKVSTNYAWLPHNQDPSLPVPKEYEGMVVQPLGDRQGFYEKFMEGCEKHQGGSRGGRCWATEEGRVDMSLRQPQSMQNYTHLGFKKIRAPDKVWKLVKKFWDNNKNNRKLENWGQGNTYTNNWESPTYMVSVEDQALRGGGSRLKQAIWDAAQETIGAWTGQELTQCSLYGIRIYQDGAILATHVDRLPLVSSAILNVDQDLDEPWPLEVIGHDGKAYNVTMEPGDMVLYESHSVLHGRPYPLKGRFLANIFIHFEPTGHSLRHNMGLDEEHDVDQAYRDSFKRLQAGHEHDNQDLPTYIIENSPEASVWKATHPNGSQRTKKKKKIASFSTGSTGAHLAAQAGDLKSLKKHVDSDKKIVNKQDINGWTPLHEATRGGHLDVVKYLIENGADPNVTTGADGGTALWWAKQTHKDDHPIIEFLESIGALESGPEL